MRTIKRIIAVLVVIGIMASSMVLTASALSWPERFAYFPTLSQQKNKDSWNGYVCALQRFLGAYSSVNVGVLDEYGYPDGLFGNKTAQAVENFQVAKGLSVDRVVGPNTWRTIAQTMWDTPTQTDEGYLTTFRANGPNAAFVIVANTYATTNSPRNYWYVVGDTTRGGIFRTDTLA